MTTTSFTPRLYVGTYQKYNGGSIRGAWLALEDYPDSDSFWEACRDLHSDELDPELMFQDFEGFPRNLYCESGLEMISKLYELISLDEREREIYFEYCDAVGCDYATIEEAQDKFAFEIESSHDYEGIAEYYVENGCMEIPEHLLNYFNYEQYGKDCALDLSISSNGFCFYS